MSDMELIRVKDTLNAELKLHPEYQEWMEFESVEQVEHVTVPRYKSPMKAGIDMPLIKASRVYNEVCEKVLGFTIESK